MNYVYLWNEESSKGRDEGTKERPVVVIACEQLDEVIRITVAPISSKEPPAAELGVPIPEKVASYLDLPGRQSWIVTTELNRFDWPGPDVRPARKKGPIDPSYGFIPAKLFESVRANIIAHARAKRMALTERTGVGDSL